MHLAGVAVLALFAVAQIPAVVYLARYCDRGDEGLPPAVRFQREGGPLERRDHANLQDRETPFGGDGPPVGGDDHSSGGGVSVIAAADAAAATRERRRCPRCGADNRPGYVRCRGCLGRLELPDGRS